MSALKCRDESHFRPEAESSWRARGRVERRLRPTARIVADLRNESAESRGNVPERTTHSPKVRAVADSFPVSISGVAVIVLRSDFSSTSLLLRRPSPSGGTTNGLRRFVRGHCSRSVRSAPGSLLLCRAKEEVTKKKGASRARALRARSTPPLTLPYRFATNFRATAKTACNGGDGSDSPPAFAKDTTTRFAFGKIDN